MKRADSNVCTPLVHVHPDADERFTVMEGIRIGVQASPVLQMIQLRNLLHNHSVEHALRNVGGPENRRPCSAEIASAQVPI